MTILSSFAFPHVISNLYEFSPNWTQNNDILKNVRVQIILEPSIEFYWMEKRNWRHSSKYLLLFSTVERNSYTLGTTLGLSSTDNPKSWVIIGVSLPSVALIHGPFHQWCKQKAKECINPSHELQGTIERYRSLHVRHLWVWTLTRITSTWCLRHSIGLTAGTHVTSFYTNIWVLTLSLYPRIAEMETPAGRGVARTLFLGGPACASLLFGVALDCQKLLLKLTRGSSGHKQWIELPYDTNNV